MQSTKILSLLFLCLLIIIGCQQNSREAARERDREARGDQYEEAPSERERTIQQQPQQQQMQEMSPGQVNVSEKIDGKVWHYVCENRCSGGVSDSHGNCPVCGKQLAHNQAYHEQQQGSQVEQMQQQEQQMQLQRDAEPAQNQQGLWHYICPKGCAGGSGSPAQCSSCGASLVHNDAYHR